MPLYCRVSLIFYRTTEAIWAKDLPETKDLLYEDCSVFTLVEKLKAKYAPAFKVFFQIMPCGVFPYGDDISHIIYFCQYQANSVGWTLFAVILYWMRPV